MTHSAKTPEQRVTLFFLVLLVGILLLLLLLQILAWLLEPSPDAATESGIQTELVLDGPDTGDRPLFVRPLSAAFGPNGDLYVSDTGNARICVFTGNGRFLREFGRNVTDTPPAQRKHALLQPAGIAVDGDGSTYVADIRRGEVLVYNRRGRYVRTIRPAGSSKPGIVWSPTDVALSDDAIAVSDSDGVVLFDRDGQFTDSIKSVGSGPKLTRPNGVAFMSDGTLVISDTNNARLVALAPRGETIWTFGGKSTGGGIIGLPRGLATFDDDSVLLADAFRFSLIRVSSDGIFVRSYGERGASDGNFQYPNDVDIRRDLILVADKENHRVQVLRISEGTPDQEER